MPIKKIEKTEEKEFKERRRFERNFENLIRQLNSDFSLERRWAARDLSQYPEAVPFLFERLKKEPDISVQEVIITSLLAINNEDVVKGFIELLKSEDAFLRNEVIEALKQIPEKVASYIEKLLHSSDPDLKIFAIDIMGSLDRSMVFKWLKEILENETHVNICATALDLVSEIGTEEFLPLIEKIKNRFSDEPYIQFICDLAKRRIGGEKNN